MSNFNDKNGELLLLLFFLMRGNDKCGHEEDMPIAELFLILELCGKHGHHKDKCCELARRERYEHEYCEHGRRRRRARCGCDCCEDDCDEFDLPEYARTRRKRECCEDERREDECRDRERRDCDRQHGHEHI